jgi:hypothetical protein
LSRSSLTTITSPFSGGVEDLAIFGIPETNVLTTATSSLNLPESQVANEARVPRPTRFSSRQERMTEALATSELLRQIVTAHYESSQAD